MVRFSLAVQPDDPKKATYLLPDKIEHYKYTPIPSGRGFWALCWRDAIETMIRTGAFLAIVSTLVSCSLLTFFAQERTCGQHGDKRSLMPSSCSRLFRYFVEGYHRSSRCSEKVFAQSLRVS